MDIDEGGTPRKMEKMEIDPPTTPSRVPFTGTPTPQFNEDFLQLTVSKTLRLSTKPSEKSANEFLSLADIHPDHPLLYSNSPEEMVGDLIFEALDLIASGDGRAAVLIEEESPVDCLQYLIESYNRTEQHEKKYSKRCCSPQVKTLLAKIRSDLCANFSLLFAHPVIFTEAEPKNYTKILYDKLAKHTIPTGFFYEVAQSESELFDNVFSPLMHYIRTEAENGSVADSSHRAALQVFKQHLVHEVGLNSYAFWLMQVLADLCEIRVETNSAVRPFCNLITRLSNWQVEPPLTEAVGREFAALTFLGPFLSGASLFAEDDPLMAEKLSSASANTSTSSASESLRPIVAGLQQEMELTRHLLHKVCATLTIIIFYTLSLLVDDNISCEVQELELGTKKP